MTIFKFINAVHPCLRKLFHWMSILGSFLVIWSMLTLLQTFLFGFIPGVWEFEVKGISIAPIVFSISSLCVVLKYISFSSPYK